MCEERVIQDTTKSGQVVLLLDEIRFLADALRDVGTTIEHCSGYLDRLCADQECPDGRDIWAHTIDTAAIDDGLDRKWDVESEDLLYKVRHLSNEARREIVLGVVEFWEQSADRRAEEVLHWLLDEVNIRTVLGETEAMSVDPGNEYV
jgi:hypothetical protein